MFLQLIQAKVADQAGVRSAFDRWQKELMAGADGFLGATYSFLDDGSLLNTARFESADAAHRNSERPEQGEWAVEFTKSLDGEPSYIDVSDAEPWLDGGSDDAGFVQVMVGHSPDVDRLLAMSNEHLDELREARPEIIGGVQGRFGDDGYVIEVFFRTEGDARSGEQMDPPDDVKAMLEERMRLMGDTHYYDLRSPAMVSPGR